MVETEETEEETAGEESNTAVFEHNNISAQQPGATALDYPEGLAGGRGRVGPKRSRGTNEQDPIIAKFC